jgi:hypothetical protein
VQLQLLGWGPDLDPATPGVLVDAYNVIPTTDGFRALEPFDYIVTSASNTGYPRAFVSAKVSGVTPHTIIAAYGSDSTLSTMTMWEIGFSGSINARGTYTATTYTTPVLFRQFDNVMYAARSGSPLKSASVGGDFTAVSGAPSCALIESTRDFLVAFNTDAAYDWHCSAIGNGTDWTLNVSNQCVRGKFFDRQGAITAAGKVGEILAAFTDTQMWTGRYSGAPDVWQWERISNDIGCVGAEAAVETPFGLCWMGRNDIYIYDGTAPRPLDTDPVRTTLFGLFTRSLIQFCQLAWDRKRGLLWVYGPPAGASRLEHRYTAFCYHFGTKKWSKAETAAHRSANQLPTSDYAFSNASVSADDMLSVWGTSGVIYLVRAYPDGQVNATGYIKSGYVGDSTTRTMIRSLRPKFSAKSSSYNGTALVETRLADLSGGATATQTATLDADFKYQLRQTGKWHSWTVTLRGEDVVSAFDVDLVPVGNR